MYHILGNIHLDGTPSRKDSAETGTVGLQLEPGGQVGRRRQLGGKKPAGAVQDLDLWRRPWSREVLPSEDNNINFSISLFIH